eukprot:g12706.t1
MHQAVPGSALGIDRTACVNDACVTQAARVVNDGGFVRFGRVAGQLSVSRSLGDHHLKECGVSGVPDVCSFTAEDASDVADGLWDAFSDDDAGEALLSHVRDAQRSGGVRGPWRWRADMAGGARHFLDMSIPRTSLGWFDAESEWKPEALLGRIHPKLRDEILRRRRGAWEAFGEGLGLIDGFSFSSVIAIAVQGGQLLVAVPFESWARKVADRALPPKALSKPLLCSVFACHPEAREEPLEEEFSQRIWVGFLNKELEPSLEFSFPAEFEADYPFVSDSGEAFIPYAESLVEVSAERYQFVTAESGGGGAASASRGERAAGGGDAGRIARLEDGMAELQKSLSSLTSVMRGSLKEMKDRAPSTPGRAPALRTPERVRRVNFRGLDGAVVDAALGAGVPEAHLQEMADILSKSPGKMEDLPRRPAKNTEGALSETEEEEPEEVEEELEGHHPRFLSPLASGVGGGREAPKCVPDLLQATWSGGKFASAVGRFLDPRERLYSRQGDAACGLEQPNFTEDSLMLSDCFVGFEMAISKKWLDKQAIEERRQVAMAFDAVPVFSVVLQALSMPSSRVNTKLPTKVHTVTKDQLLKRPANLPIFASFLKQKVRCTLLARANFPTERGMPDTGSYDSFFERWGINQLDVPFADGTAPPKKLVSQLISSDTGERCKPECDVVSVVVHCKSGLGRSMALLAALAIAFCPGLTAGAFFGWARLVRPACLQTPMQERFLRSLDETPDCNCFFACFKSKKVTSPTVISGGSHGTTDTTISTTAMLAAQASAAHPLRPWQGTSPSPGLGASPASASQPGRPKVAGAALVAVAHFLRRPRRCMRRVLQPFAIEPINPFAAEMQANIKALGGNGLGLLDAEGAGKELSTCLESSGMDPSEELPIAPDRPLRESLSKWFENRQKWREFCYGLENLGEYCSAVLMEEEALKFTSSAGRTLPQILSDAGVESSMRVDQGFVPLNSFGEKATEGIVLLEERCEDFYASGVRIAKWRTQVECNLEMPTDVSVWENTDCLARAARVCQENGLAFIAEIQTSQNTGSDPTSPSFFVFLSSSLHGRV